MTDEARHLFVTETEAGCRLDRILAERWPDCSRSRLHKAFASGAILVDGLPRRKSFQPSAGSEVVVALSAPQPLEAEPEDIPLTIIYQDAHLLVIDKPADLVVHPAPGHPGGTLVNALLHHDRKLIETGDPIRPGLVHRLDRGTTGLLVIARTPRAHQALAEQLRRRELGRRYLALSWGNWQRRSGELRGAIGRHPRDRKRMAVLPEGGRDAVTRYEVIEDFGFVELCRVELETGRTHQIRVHFTHYGHPVVGDPLYGDDRRARNTRAADRAAAARLVNAAGRQFLHAAEISFTHPDDGRRLTFAAPLPDDFAAALDGLRRDLG